MQTSLSTYYGALLKEQADTLNHLHSHTKMPAAYAKKADILGMSSASQGDDPAFVDAYAATRLSYGFSDLQDSFICKRLSLSGHIHPYTLYNDRVFNMLNGFYRSWDIHNSTAITRTMRSDIASMCQYTLDEVKRKQHVMSISFNGQKYYETAYRNMVTGAVSLAMHRRLVTSDAIQAVPEQKESLLEYLQQQEQLTLNCTNLYYLFYENLAAEHGITIGHKIKPELALMYPASVPS